MGDPAALEAALEALPEGVTIRVLDVDNGPWGVVRVPSGWHIVGDVTVTSGDIAEGGNVSIAVLDEGDLAGPGWALVGEDPFDEEDYFG